MNIAIIGAGACGLAALKNSIEQGHSCEVYEQTGDIGGLWVYRDETEDEDGLPICAPMYQHLRTNLPKEVMSFLDFPYPSDMEESFIDPPEVVKYLRRYAFHFNLEKYIKYYTRVTLMKPLPNEKWSVSSRDVKSKEEKCKEYDAVFICIGRAHVPNTPNIPGGELFGGTQLHSLFYRKPEPFSNKRVLIIGNGASGVDIARIVDKVSQQVYISQRRDFILEPPKSVIKKSEVSYFDQAGAIFTDGSREDIDVVIYCTGYKYDFPFLSEECGIQVEDNWIKHLHKHIVNIEHPTMFFIGIPLGLVPIFEIQVRFALAALSKQFELPFKDVMMQELQECVYEKKSRGIPTRYTHKLQKGSERIEPYIDDLVATAGIQPIPKVYMKITNLIKSGGATMSHCFKLLDDDNFIMKEMD